ncbi:IPT/TIG domain-containing protein [Tenacibaculum geojense]|uniref:IPT/TIG domain-containing protein n=1 Tax=Tenacibaculum geojense TaxID=915352 RepID=A0ABW3JSS0_9FLAO
MKKITFLKYLFAFNILIISCSKSDVIQEETISDNDPRPEIDSLSSEFLKVGETLIITGKNLKSQDNQTSVYINGNSFDVTSTTDTEVTVRITEQMGVEEKTIAVKVGNLNSQSKELFILPNGWYKIDTELNIKKAFIFNGSDDIILLANTATGNAYYGSVMKIKTSSEGYKTPETLNIPGGNKDDLIMYNTSIGATATAGTGYFTKDGFQTSKAFGNFTDHDNTYAINSKIMYLDENSCIVVNCCGDHLYTNDQGETSGFASLWRSLGMENKFRYFASNKLSDGYIYAAGINLTSNPYSNLIVKSLDGVSNWEIVENTTTPYSIGNVNMLDTDFFIQLHVGNKQVQKSNDFAVTWTVIKDNVTHLSIKDRNTWYIVIDDKLYVTNDSGNTWELEFELPIDTNINHMSFSENKILLSGDKILLIKHF